MDTLTDLEAAELAFVNATGQPKPVLVMARLKDETENANEKMAGQTVAKLQPNLETIDVVEIQRLLKAELFSPLQVGEKSCAHKVARIVALIPPEGGKLVDTTLLGGIEPGKKLIARLRLDLNLERDKTEERARPDPAAILPTVELEEIQNDPDDDETPKNERVVASKVPSVETSTVDQISPVKGILYLVKLLRGVWRLEKLKPRSKLLNLTSKEATSSETTPGTTLVLNLRHLEEIHRDETEEVEPKRAEPLISKEVK